MPTPAAPVKVAVIGSGLAGLTAANRLVTYRSSEGLRFEVHVFEKCDTLGMDAHSLSVSVDEGSEGKPVDWRIDVPMRSFQGGYYPNLIQLYERLGVQFREADFSYSFSTLSWASKRRITTKMIYNGASGRAGVSMPNAMKRDFNGFFLRRFIGFLVFLVSTLQLLLNYIQVSLRSSPMMRPPPDITFAEWIERTTPSGLIFRWLSLDKSWREFCFFILVPLFSAVCTAPSEDVLAHPAEEFLEYIWLTLFTHHYVVQHGVRDVVSRLSAPLQHIHTSAEITMITPDNHSPETVSIYTRSSAQGELRHPGFRHIILATQANSAAKILRTYQKALPDTSAQKGPVGSLVKCLQSFLYRPTIVINHRDSNLMPDDRDDWRDLNLIDSPPDTPHYLHPNGELCLPPSYTMATHMLSKPQSSSRHAPQVFQTTNPVIPPRLETILSVSRLERAVLTVRSKRALANLTTPDGKLGPLQGAGRLDRTATPATRVPGIWVCGAYAYKGIPLLEGCVVSAMNVVDNGVILSESSSQ